MRNTAFLLNYKLWEVRLGIKKLHTYCYILSILSLHCVNEMKIQSNLKMFATDVEKNETDILCLVCFLSYYFEIIKQKGCCAYMSELLHVINSSDLPDIREYHWHLLSIIIKLSFFTSDFIDWCIYKYIFN